MDSDVGGGECWEHSSEGIELTVLSKVFASSESAGEISLSSATSVIAFLGMMTGFVQILEFDEQVN